jgi:hypothetical protein
LYHQFSRKDLAGQLTITEKMAPFGLQNAQSSYEFLKNGIILPQYMVWRQKNAGSAFFYSYMTVIHGHITISRQQALLFFAPEKQRFSKAAAGK